MIYLKAFVVGGLICTLVQIFLDNTKLMPGRVMVLLVIAGVILGAAGLYEPLIKWAGCGASVPLSISNPANQLKGLGKKTENIKIPGN